MLPASHPSLFITTATIFWSHVASPFLLSPHPLTFAWNAQQVFTAPCFAHSATWLRVQGTWGKGKHRPPQHQEWGDASLPPGGTLCTLGPFIPLSDDPSTFPTWACASAISLTWKVDPRIPAKAQHTPSPPGVRLLHPSAAPSAAPPGAPPPHLTLPSSGPCGRLGHLFASH